MRRLKTISIFILIQIFLVTSSLWAMRDTANLSPKLNLQSSIIQPFFNTQRAVINKLPMFAIDSEDYEDVKDIVKHLVEFSNIYLLNKYRFDLNASFFKKYRSSNPEEVLYDAVKDMETDKGGICLELSIALQKKIYDSILDKSYFSNIKPGRDIQVDIIKPLGHELAYELGITINGQQYKVRGYIIGSIAGDTRTKIKASESEYLRILHFSSMTKIIAPDGRQFRIVGEPGWGIKKGITTVQEGKEPENNYSISKTTESHIDLHIQQSPELSWLNETAQGRKWRESLRQSGITLFNHRPNRMDIRYIFFDRPLNRETMNSFRARYMNVSGSLLQKIVKTNGSAGLFDAIAYILIKPDAYLSDKNFSMEVDFRVMTSNRAVGDQFSYEQLLEILTEIEQKNKEEYSKNTWMFVHTGLALRMISPQQVQSDIKDSEFYKRFKTLLDPDNLAHYLRALDIGVEYLDMKGFENAEDIFNQEAWVRELKGEFVARVSRFFSLIAGHKPKRQEYALALFNELDIYITESEKDFFQSVDYLNEYDFVELILGRIETAHRYNNLGDRFEIVKYYADITKEGLKKHIIVGEVEKLMKEKMGVAFRSDYHHGLQHAKDLIAKAKDLVGKMGCDSAVDWKVLAGAIYLHDIYAGRSEDSHGEDAAIWAEEHLQDEEYFTKEQISNIKEAVRLHDKKISQSAALSKEPSLEAKILYDVDNLDAFGIKGVYRYFAAHIMRETKRGASAAEVLDIIKQKVPYNVQKRFENLYFDESRQMAENDYPLTKDFFDKLAQEKYVPDSCFGATGVFNYIFEGLQSPPWVMAEKAVLSLEHMPVDENTWQDAEFACDYFKELAVVYENIREQINGRKSTRDFDKKKDFNDIAELVEQSI